MLYRTWSNCNGFNKFSFALFVNGAMFFFVAANKQLKLCKNSEFWQPFVWLPKGRKKRFGRDPSVLVMLAACLWLFGSRCPPLPFVMVVRLSLDKAQTPGSNWNVTDLPAELVLGQGRSAIVKVTGSSSVSLLEKARHHAARKKGAWPLWLLCGGVCANLSLSAAAVSPSRGALLCGQRAAQPLGCLTCGRLELDNRAGPAHPFPLPGAR